MIVTVHTGWIFFHPKFLIATEWNSVKLIFLSH